MQAIASTALVCLSLMHTSLSFLPYSTYSVLAFLSHLPSASCRVRIDCGGLSPTSPRASQALHVLLHASSASMSVLHFFSFLVTSICPPPPTPGRRASEIAPSFNMPNSEGSRAMSQQSQPMFPVSKQTVAPRHRS